jgi:hypothetical protein
MVHKKNKKTIEAEMGGGAIERMRLRVRNGRGRGRTG